MGRQGLNRPRAEFRAFPRQTDFPNRGKARPSPGSPWAVPATPDFVGLVFEPLCSPQSQQVLTCPARYFRNSSQVQTVSNSGASGCQAGVSGKSAQRGEAQTTGGLANLPPLITRQDPLGCRSAPCQKPTTKGIHHQMLPLGPQVRMGFSQLQSAKHTSPKGWCPPLKKTLLRARFLPTKGPWPPMKEQGHPHT
jgi:hypothetical protein